MTNETKNQNTYKYNLTDSSMKKGNSLAWIIGIIVLIVIIAGLIWYNQAPKGDIQIGALFALTGKMAMVGTTELNFANIAIEEINAAGGINGRQINLVVEDDMGSGKDAVTAANKLMAQDIKIILGPSSGGVTAAVQPVTSKNKVIIFADTTSVKGLFDNSKYSFRTTPVSSDSAPKIARIAKNKYSLSSVAIITEQTEFAKSWSNDFKESFESLGGNVLVNEEYASGTTDFRSILTKIKDADAESVFISVQAAPDAINLLKQMKELGLLDTVKIMGNPSVVEASVYNGSGGILPSDAFTVLPSSENAELLAKYVAKYNAQPGYQFFLSAAAYDSVYILKKAIEACGEDNDCIDSYIKNDLKDYEGAVAVWNFDNDGDPVLADKYFKELNIVKGNKVFSDISA